MRPSAGRSATIPGVVPKPACPVAPRGPRLSALCWQNLGDIEDTAMRPGAAVSQDGILAPKRSGLASRFAGAILFFLVGAITATELYPQMVVDRHSDDNRTWDSERTAARSPDVLSDRTAVFPQDDALNTGGPIPPVTFAPAQPTPAVKEAQSPADEAASAAVEKPPRRIEARSARTKASSSRRNGSTYQKEPSYGATGTGWFSFGGAQTGFDFGPRQSQSRGTTQLDRRGQFATWR
jgi:hypothetical protein